MSNKYVFIVLGVVWITIAIYIYILRRRDPQIQSQIVIKFILMFFITFGFTILGNIKLGSLPPIGPFLDPANGYLALVGSDKIPEKNLILEGLKENVTVIWDDRRIPHIFAENDRDLYFTQGYIHAFDRLWQLEFQVMAAGGRLSEILGARTVKYDRFQRRIGMRLGAENALKMYENDPVMKDILNAYTNGINTYIHTLNKDQYPIEYKILDYAPAEWTLMKTALLYMYMAWELTGRSDDLYHTGVLNEFSLEIYNELFPLHPEELDPIIPESKQWTFKPVQVASPEIVYKSEINMDKLQFKPNPHNGSNNWVISGSRSKTGKPILANDPHLEMTLPSIWYENHLISPNMNVYGVSLLGAAGVVIGFNKDIAWGVTNGGFDVLDFYDVWFNDNNLDEYWYDGNWKPTTKRIEKIKIRGGDTIQDTVVFTHHGPVVFLDRNEKSDRFGRFVPVGRAMQWLAHKPSMEGKAFYKLNRAKDYNDYVDAIDNFSCPGQNFVFASKQGDIAIWHATDIPVKWKHQGQFILDGSDSKHNWQDFADNLHRPHSLNPESGYLSSANQNPVTEDYPYFYSGMYALPFRGARINQLLEKMNKSDYTDLQEIQLDIKNILAERIIMETLPVLNSHDLNKTESRIVEEFSSWDFTFEGNLIQPTVFVRYLNILEELTWKDEFGENGDELIWPNSLVLSCIAINEKNSDWFDNIATSEEEDFEMLALAGFRRTIKELSEELGEIDASWQWQNYRGTDINHLAKIPGFGRTDLKTSGGKYIPNATQKTHGPSWRYVVELGDHPKAYGIYPGGQSGFPGSIHYDEFVNDWVNGVLYPLNYPENINDIQGKKLTLAPNDE